MRILILTIILSSFISCKGEKAPVAQKPVDHSILSDLLAEHVKKDKVDYEGLKLDSARINEYLGLLSHGQPGDSWSKEQRLAFWINAYNAFTLKLIIDNYPLESITDLHPAIHIPLVNTVWHKKFFQIGGSPMSLDQIEHKILRKEFNEPRIHFAINCASISCPPLRNEAFTAEKLESQLEDQTKLFINDPTRNILNDHNPQLSKIFSWFSGDFKRGQTLIEFINRYATTKIDTDADIDYLEYDWGLNDVK